jgi:hypothetical protein
LYSWLDDVLRLAALATVLLAAAMVLGVICWRFFMLNLEQRTAREQAHLEPLFVQYIAGECDAMSILPELKTRYVTAENMLLSYLVSLNGEERERLVELARMTGFVNAELRALRNSEWTRREIAAMRLGVMGLPETVPSLTRLLRDGQIAVRYTAARSLAIIGSPEAFQALIGLLGRPHLLDTARLLEIVQHAPRNDVEPLRRMIDDPRTPLVTRMLLIDLAGDWREYRVVDTLRDLLSEENKELVTHSIKALARMGDIDSLPAIIQMNDDSRWEIRAQVAKAAGLLDFAEALPLLRRSLTDEAFWVRRNAAEALVKFGPAGKAALQSAGLLNDQFASDLAEYQLERLNGHHETPAADESGADEARHTAVLAGRIAS